MRCLSRQFLHLTVQVHTTDANLFGNHIYVEVGVGNILVDDTHDTLQELLIGRLHFHFCNLLLQRFGLAILLLQNLLRVQHINDRMPQNVHVERFHDIGIGAGGKSLQFIFVTVLGRQHDDRNMTGDAVGLDLGT